MLKTPGKAKTVAPAIAALGCLATASPAQAGILGTFVRTAPSGYTWPVPAGDTISVSVFGAKGGDYVASDGTRTLGGLGALASGELAVTPGQQFSLIVAGQGANGG